MPNTFAGYNLIDPRDERRDRRRFLRDEIPELAYANSFYCPAGRWPARGWILLRRSALNALSKYRTNFQLQLEDFRQTSSPLTFSNLALVQARCVSRGVASDPEAVYLVEITDGRGILWNQWMQLPTGSAYNIRAPAHPEQFYAQSMNGASAWTWTTLLTDLWNQMGTFLGAFPGLPATIATPEGWWFPGMPAWTALNDIIEYLGFVLTADLTNATAPYAIVDIGVADAAFAALTAQYTSVLEDDYEFIDVGAGRVPGTVVVLFHRRNQFYGTEETVRRDSLQWAMTPYYAAPPVAAPAAFTGAVGTHFLWSGFTVRYDVNGAPLAADVATAATIAADEVTSYFNTIYDGTAGFMRRIYTGTLPFVTGSLVDGVAWREDVRQRAGWQTIVARGPKPPFPEVKLLVP